MQSFNFSADANVVMCQICCVMWLLNTLPLCLPLQWVRDLFVSYLHLFNFFSSQSHSTLFYPNVIISFCSFVLWHFFFPSLSYPHILSHFPNHWSDRKVVLSSAVLTVVQEWLVWLYSHQENSFWVILVPIHLSNLYLLLCPPSWHKLLGKEWQQGKCLHQPAYCVGFPS